MTGKQTFEAVVAQHGPTVLRVCRAVVGLPDADDAWSETFLSAMRAYPALPDDANVEAWLVTIAHRKAIDITRRTARRPTPMAAPPDRAFAASPGGGDDPDHDLVDVMQQLPPRQREAVAYHFLGGLPYTVVADIIGGNAAAARRAGADGMATLRRTYSLSAEQKAHRP